MTNTTTTGVSDPGPLDWRIAMVDKAGRPTPEFQRRWNTQRQINGLIGTTKTGSGPPFGTPATGQTYVDLTATPPQLYVDDNGVWTKVGASEFIELTDAPDSYTGAGNKLLQVNSGATAVEFSSLSSFTANPSAIASDTAVNGSASTFMRSDAAPAIQKASSSQFGIVQVDGTTITSSGGIISSTGGGGGGGTPPTIRSHSSGFWNASSVTIPLPSGTTVGDVVFVYWMNGFEINTFPSGWEPIWISANGANFTNQACIGKVMTSSDISAGNVTVTATGSFGGLWFTICLVGSTSHSFTTFNHSDSGGSTSIPSVPITGFQGVPTTNLMFGFCSSSSRSGGMNMTISSNLTIIDNQNNTNASGILFTISSLALPSGFFSGLSGLNELVTLPVSNNGAAMVIIACQ